MTNPLSSTQAAPEEFTAAIHAFLQWRVEIEKRNCSIVVGLVDEHESHILSCGKPSKDSTSDVDGDTIYEIGSITKTFTGILLQDLIDRGEVKADDPAAKYLPPTVRMPARRGKQITLLHLATHTSGLPRMPDNLKPKRADNLAVEFDAQKLYDFLSRHELQRNPGVKFEYSNVGLGLLGHIVALKTGIDFESLVIERICRPLKMESTCITLTPELRQRLAQGHNLLGYPMPGLHFAPAMMGTGAIRSTANDLLKYVSANLGLAPSSSLTPTMHRMHELQFRAPLRHVGLGLTWMIQRDPQGHQILSHGGATDGYSAFAGFDKPRRRGVVLLSNSVDLDLQAVGKLLLESEWHTNRRPKAIKPACPVDASCVGRYRLAPDLALGMLAARAGFQLVSKTMIAIPAVLCVALLAILLWRGSYPWIILVGAVIFAGLLANAALLGLSRFICRVLRPVIGIRREGDRFFIQPVQPTVTRSSLLLPIHDPAVYKGPFTLPQITAELVPDSDARLHERLSNTPLFVSRNARGQVTRLTGRILGGSCCFEKISDEPPERPPAPQTRVAIKLDAKLLDACAGEYIFPASPSFPTGIKLAISHQNDQLVGQAWGTNVLEGAFDLYAESETDFFVTVVAAQLTFIKNSEGEIITSILHLPGQPDLEGTKA